MKYQEVESSNIAAIAHFNNTLGVKFKSGAEYVYDNVPVALFEQLASAASVGRTFNELIKCNAEVYPAHKVA